MISIKSRQKWESIFQQWDASGLSAAEFCRQNGINRQVFYNMRYRLAHSQPETERLLRPISFSQELAAPGSCSFVQIVLEETSHDSI